VTQVIPPRCRISIALATYQGAAFLEAQLRSILAQSRLPDQLVLSDDASTDATVAIAEATLATAPFEWMILQNPGPCGSSRNFAHALTRCTGDLIFFCDQDDIWDLDKIMCQAQILETSTELGYCFCDARLVDAQLKPSGARLWSSLSLEESIKRYNSGREAQASILLRQPLVTGTASVFRRSLLEALLPIPEGWIHDHWFSLAAAISGQKGYALDAALLAYRQHPQQQVGGQGLDLWGRLRNAWRTPPCIEAARFWQRAAKELAHRFPDSSSTVDASKMAVHLRICSRGRKRDFTSRVRIFLKEYHRGMYRFRNGSILSLLRDILLH